MGSDLYCFTFYILTTNLRFSAVLKFELCCLCFCAVVTCLQSCWCKGNCVGSGTTPHVTRCLIIVFLIDSSMVSTHRADRLAVLRSGSRLSDYVRITLQKCNIQLSDLEASASDRDVWKTVCEIGLNNFMNGWINTSMKRRAARNVSTAKPKTPRCPHCSRLCASDFGLRSHLRSHTSTRPDN